MVVWLHALLRMLVVGRLRVLLRVLVLTCYDSGRCQRNVRSVDSLKSIGIASKNRCWLILAQVAQLLQILLVSVLAQSLLVLLVHPTETLFQSKSNDYDEEKSPDDRDED